MKTEENEDVIWFEFTGGKTEGINEAWGGNYWVAELSYLRNIPLKNDIINFAFGVDQVALSVMIAEFGTSSFIVFKRELNISKVGDAHSWDIHIKPYFPNKD